MPAEVNNRVVYGENLRAIVATLSNHAYVGMKKIGKLMGDVFGLPIFGVRTSNIRLADTLCAVLICCVNWSGFVISQTKLGLPK